MTSRVTLTTDVGDFEAVFNDKGLAEIFFPDRARRHRVTEAQQGQTEITEVKVNSSVPSVSSCSTSFPPHGRRHSYQDEIPETWKRDTAAALAAALRGKPPAKLPPLDTSRGTPFQREVWKALLKIPCGETRTYGELAAAIGAPHAARAVGAACGANPIPVLVPCHRVLAANGKLGGFSAGLKWKRLLLERENASVANGWF